MCQEIKGTGDEGLATLLSFELMTVQKCVCSIGPRVNVGENDEVGPGTLSRLSSAKGAQEMLSKALFMVRTVVDQ